MFRSHLRIKARRSGSRDRPRVELSVRLGDEKGARAISLHYEGNGLKLRGLNLPARCQEVGMSLPESKPWKSM
jgi:hypothetical protein